MAFSYAGILDMMNAVINEHELTRKTQKRIEANIWLEFVCYYLDMMAAACRYCPPFE